MYACMYACHASCMRKLNLDSVIVTHPHPHIYDIIYFHNLYYTLVQLNFSTIWYGIISVYLERKEKSNPQYRRTKCRIVECSSPKCVSLFDWTANDSRYTSRTFYSQPESRSDSFCHSPQTSINSAMEQVTQLLHTFADFSPSLSSCLSKLGKEQNITKHILQAFRTSFSLLPQHAHSRRIDRSLAPSGWACSQEPCKNLS